MIAIRIQAPFATFRKSFARGYAETYRLAPPATVYGMLLSLIGERFRQRHQGVRLAFAYAHKTPLNDEGICTCLPRVATCLRKLSRYKYGVALKQSTLGNAPDYVESLCDLDFVCWIESSREESQESTLEQRVITALNQPEKVTRYGVLCLGLSDDVVDDVSHIPNVTGFWHRLIPSTTGNLELPIWVDHVGASKTRWQRYTFEGEPTIIGEVPTTWLTSILP